MKRYELLEDVDESEPIELPRGYTGRIPTWKDEQRGMGQMDMKRGLVPMNVRPPMPTVPADSATRLDPARCPPCPRCPPDRARPRPDSDSLLGLVIGMGFLGSALWYSGKLMSPGPVMGLDDEEEEEGEELEAGPEIGKDGWPTELPELVSEVPVGAVAVDVEEG